MEINVGDYVRTDNGIAKCIDIDKNNGDYIFDKSIFYELDGQRTHILYKYYLQDEIDDGMKISPNIIDLIEEFDYIKINDWGNMKFWRVVKAPYGKLMFEDDGWNELEDFVDEKISEIITHEQIESIAYKVGE